MGIMFIIRKISGRGVCLMNGRDEQREWRAFRGEVMRHYASNSGIKFLRFGLVYS